MRVLQVIVLGGVAWLWMTATASAQVDPPHGGSPRFLYIYGLSPDDPGGLQRFTRRLNWEGGIGTSEYFETVIVGWQQGPFRPSSPLVEFTLDPDLAIQNPPIWGRGGVVDKSMYVYHQSVVTLREGFLGDFRGPVDSIFLYDQSTLNVAGGAVKRPIRAFDGSHVAITGGVVEDLFADGNSTIDFTGGNFRTGGLELFASGHGHITTTVSGLNLFRARAIDSGRITMTDAKLDFASAAGSSVVNLTNAAVRFQGLSASDGGTIIQNSGTVAGGVIAIGESHLFLTDVSIGGNVSAAGSSTILFNGNTTIGGNLSGADDTVITLSNSTVGGDANATGQSTLNLNNVIVTGDAGAAGSKSLLNMVGGKVGGELAARGMSTVNLVGGEVKGLGAADDGTVIMASGEVIGNVVGIGKAKIKINGGNIGGGVGAKEHATVIIEGGRVAGIATGGDLLGLYVTDFGNVDVDGAEILNGAVADRVAGVNLLSGRIVGNFVADGGALVHIGEGSLTNDFEITENLEARTNAKVVINSGRVGGSVFAGGDSEVTINYGQIDKFFWATGNAKVRIDDIDGGITGSGADFSAFDKSQVSINGGKFGAVTAFGTSRISITNGKFGSSIYVKDSAQLTFSGGEIDVEFLLGNLIADDASTVTMTGGRIDDFLEANGSSHVNVAGGIVTKNLEGYGDSVVTMTGGRVNLFAIFRDNSKFTFSGGSIGLGIIDQGAAPLKVGQLMLAAEDELANAIFMHDNATLNVIGNDLEAILIDPNYQEMFSLYQLSGAFADGTPISGECFAIQNGTGASFHLLPVPEPGTLAILATAAAFLGRRRPSTQRAVDRDRNSTVMGEFAF